MNTDKICVGSFLCDLDGTLFKHGTTELLPGAKEFLDKLHASGYRIIFMTRRGDIEFENHPVYSKRATVEMLQHHGLSDHTIIYDVMSPRVLVDDSQIDIMRRVTDTGFSEDELYALFS